MHPDAGYLWYLEGLQTILAELDVNESKTISPDRDELDFDSQQNSNTDAESVVIKNSGDKKVDIRFLIVGRHADAFEVDSKHLSLDSEATATVNFRFHRPTDLQSRLSAVCNLIVDGKVIRRIELRGLTSN